MSGLPPFETHCVDNQPPDFAPRDLWSTDIALREAVEANGAGGFAGDIAAYARLAGDTLYRLSFELTAATLAWAFLTILAAAFVSGLLVRRRLDHLDLVAVLKERE